MKYLVLFLSIFALVSCNRDPNVVKQRYLENGNKYFERGRFKEASIMYRQALQKDLKFGQAHYRLALTELKLGRVPNAVGSLRRAVELLPPGGGESLDAQTKLADVYLAVGSDKQLLQEAENMIGNLFEQNPESYDAHRLQGDLAFARARDAFRAGDREQGAKLLQSTIQSYRKANSIKPDQVHLLLAMGRALAASNQLDEAESLYKRAIELETASVLPYRELYQLYLIRNRMQDAETLLKTGFRNAPKEYSFLTLLAAHYYVQRRREDMIKVLDELKSHQKDFKDAHITAGDFYLRLGDGDGAIAQYKAGMQLDAERKAVYQKRIIEVLMRQGKRAEAAQVNDEILKANPQDNDARGLSASLLLDKGDIQKAMQDLQSVVTAAPDNFVARFNLGRSHMARGELEQARQQFAEAIRLRPSYVPPRLALAQLHVMRREFDQAIRVADEALKYDSGSVGARLIQSGALLGQSKFNESRALLEGMLKADPNSANVWFQLGLVNLAQRRHKEAEEAFRKTYQFNPTNTRGLMGVVETYLAQGKLDDAMRTLEAEAQKYPDRPEFHVMLGNTAVRAGRFDEGLGHFKSVLSKVDAGSRAAADAHLRIGETLRRKGDTNNAISSLQKAAEILPSDRIVVTTLALALDAGGRRDEARRAYEQTLRLDPDNGIALNNLAFLMAETGGDLNQALTYAQRAKQRLPNMTEVSDTLGWIYLKKNLSDNAVDIFRDLVTKVPNHPTYRYHLGMALSQKGDKPAAIKELQQALKSNPSRDEAQKIKELLASLG